MNTPPTAPDGERTTSQFLSDDELTTLALEADPLTPLDPDARPWEGAILHRVGLLPDWYMPTLSAARTGRGTRLVVISLIAGFLAINAAGLCITSGFISLA